jgi:hypothetical protein
MIHPYITLWKNNLNTDYPNIKQGSVHRDFLKETYNSHAYHCQPMTTAHVSGWEFLLPQDVTIIWDGISDSSGEHIKILEGQFYNDQEIVRTNTGNGILTFELGVAIETDNNHYSVLKGSPNYFFQDADPVEVIIRSDYFNFLDNFFCWKIKVADKPITFPKGMPIAFLVNYPVQLLESTKIKFAEIDDDKIKQKEEYYKIKKEFSDKSDDWQWPNFYKKGILSETNKINVQTKPKLMEP